MTQNTNTTPAYRQRSGYDEDIVTLTDAVTNAATTTGSASTASDNGETSCDRVVDLSPAHRPTGSVSTGLMAGRSPLWSVNRWRSSRKVDLVVSSSSAM